MPSVLTILALSLALAWLPAAMSGPTASAGDGAWSAADRVPAGDARLLRSTSRISPLQPNQPLGKGSDLEDPDEVGCAAVPAWPVRRPVVRVDTLPLDPAVALPRPLHGRPQSPRGPPRLA
ncbi:MAG TPA: hypothetical protein VF210_12340 [Pseudomonadales bacterium]